MSRFSRPGSGDEEEDSSNEPPSPAHDTLGGHVVLGAAFGLFVPFGSLDGISSQSDLERPGYVIGGDLGYGVSRTVVVGAYGEVGSPAGAGACSNCKVSSLSAGAMVRYHLVQGLRFDPWLSAGAGFRRTSLGPDTYTGLDFARLALGGDYYPFPSIGFGPLVEVDLGTYLNSTAPTGSRAVDAHFVLGGRIVFDGPGK